MSCRINGNSMRLGGKIIVNLLAGAVWLILSVFLSAYILPPPGSKEVLPLFLLFGFCVFLLPMIVVEVLYELYQEYHNTLYMNKDLFTQGVHHIRRLTDYRRKISDELAMRLHTRLTRDSDSRASDIGYIYQQAQKASEVFFASLEQSAPLAEAMDKTYKELYS